MERHKDLTLSVMVWVLLMMISSCRSNAPSATAQANHFGKGDLVKAMVLDYSELDGCTFILELEDGTKLEPVELPESFRSDSLKVLVKYTMVKRASICMVGQMVTVSEIKTCKDK